MSGVAATTNASHALLLPAASARRSIWFSSVTPAFPFCARPHSSLSGFVAKSGPATVVSHHKAEGQLMSESLTRQQKITKQAVHGKGVVVAQNSRAAEVGAEILRKGGNAIDAAVATGMAIGALEPWMSGIGGVGFMTIWSAKEGRAWTVDYGPISAKKLDPSNYKIVGPGPANAFAWPDILEQRNEVGYHSIAVPGMVAGLAKALERFGTLKWKDVLAPGVALAERGMQLDWYMQVMIANGAEHLSKFPASKANYLPDDGRVPMIDWQANDRFIKLGNLGETYQRLADGG